MDSKPYENQRLTGELVEASTWATRKRRSGSQLATLLRSAVWRRTAEPRNPPDAQRVARYGEVAGRYGYALWLLLGRAIASEFEQVLAGTFRRNFHPLR
jgi:hypothetical protein